MATITCEACGASVECERTGRNAFSIHYMPSFLQKCRRVQERLHQGGHWSVRSDWCPDLDAVVKRAVDAGRR